MLQVSHYPQFVHQHDRAYGPIMDFAETWTTNGVSSLKSQLDKYFTTHVQLCREEKKLAYSETMPVIEQLAKYVHKQDPRFGAEVIKVGSSFQGLKVGDPNEYDVNIPLQGFKVYGWGPYQPRFYDIKKSAVQQNGAFGPELPPHFGIQQQFNAANTKRVDDITIHKSGTAQPAPSSGYTFMDLNSDYAMWRDSDDLTFCNDVIPILVKKQFKKLLMQGVRELGLRNKMKFDTKIHGPAVTLKITTHSQSNDFQLSVDFSAVIDRGAPFPSYAGWPHPRTAWPSQEKKEIISNIGVSFVTKKDLHWMVSPSLAERELMKGIDQPDECRKKSHRIMKKLNEDLWCPSGKGISSYALKNILFWECEKFPSREQWLNCHLAERVISMTKYLLKCVTSRHLPKYFVPTFNIFDVDEKGKQELINAATKIEMFLRDPVNIMMTLNNNN